MPRRAGVGWGLRARLTVLSTALVALVSALLVWLGWLLVGGVAGSVPSLPAGTLVRVGEFDVPAEQVTAAIVAAARQDVLRAGLVAFPLVVIAAGLVSWVLVGRVLAPLHRVTATARRLSAESLDERIGLREAQGEVAELAAGFDAMLDRLQAAFEAQRRFVANASHELRTPLAVLRTEIDVTLADPDADVAELRRMGEVVRAASRRADDLVSALLLLARAEALGPGSLARAPASRGLPSGAPAFTPPRSPQPAGRGEPTTGQVDLADAAAQALRAVAAEAAERGLSVRAGGGSAPVSGDVALLERVAGNLVENAVRHNVDGGTIEVCTGRDGPWAFLTVRSTGPVIEAEQVAELFEPFRRGPVARTASTPGSGLGLSIVRAVVAAHGGTVGAVPVPGGGLEVTATLPHAGPA